MRTAATASLYRQENLAKSMDEILENVAAVFTIKKSRKGRSIRCNCLQAKKHKKDFLGIPLPFWKNRAKFCSRHLFFPVRISSKQTVGKSRDPAGYIWPLQKIAIMITSSGLAKLLAKRAEGKCELCSAETALALTEVLPQQVQDQDNSLLACAKCKVQIDKKELLDPVHWQCLETAIWSEIPGVKVTAWRMLNRFREQTWAADLLDMAYLDDDQLAWAKQTGDHDNDGSVDLHKDCDGNLLATGDTVALIKTLDVKGTSLSIKTGTVVKNIRLVHDNTEQIEGKIEGQQIVILTQYVRKQSSR